MYFKGLSKPAYVSRREEFGKPRMRENNDGWEVCRDDITTEKICLAESDREQFFFF